LRAQHARRTRSGTHRLLARDGGVFDFADATYQGSSGGLGITDVIGFAPTPSGNGYWILRRNGRKYTDPFPVPGGQPYEVDGPSVANFGDAPNLVPFFFHNAYIRPAEDLDFAHDPVVAIVGTPGGYALLRPIISNSGYGV
jgi:hypothetical protein